MSRKLWSEEMRHEEICRLEDKIIECEMRVVHLQSENWRKPYPKESSPRERDARDRRDDE